VPLVPLAPPVSGRGGLPRLVLIAPDGASAELYLHGAHVTSWVPAGGREQLFLSERSAFAPGRAIRGGVPVIFPQFAEEGPLPRHGFARTAEWTPVEPDHTGAAGAAGDSAAATLMLRDSPATRAVWPQAFEARLTVRVGGPQLEMTLAVTNTGAMPLAFTGALHGYLRVTDVAHVAVAGLAGLRYRDQAAGGVERADGDPAVRVVGELDRVYLGVPGPVLVREPSAGTLALHTEGFSDVVVWNPGPERGAALDDLEPDGWRRMLCVEPAIVSRPVRLAPGERWTGRQLLRSSAAVG
jgi:glucose-6-phosphate 1-epimerase